MVWGAFQKHAWRLRSTSMGAIVGVELELAKLQCVRGDVDEEVAEELLAECEQALVVALNKKEAEPDGGQD